MKNTKKIISLILAVCMIASLAISASAANTVDVSGGTGTSSVTLKKPPIPAFCIAPICRRSSPGSSLSFQLQKGMGR